MTEIINPEPTTMTYLIEKLGFPITSFVIMVCHCSESDRNWRTGEGLKTAIVSLNGKTYTVISHRVGLK